MKIRFVQFIALLIFHPSIGHATSLLAIRVWPAQDYTRVTIESKHQIKFTQNFSANNNQTIIDLYDINVNAMLNELPAKIIAIDPQIKNVRLEQLSSNVTRLIFQLKIIVKVQIFTLKPVGHYQHRLIIDFYPKTISDPLLLLINKQQKKHTSSVSTQNQMLNTSSNDSSNNISSHQKIYDEVEYFFKKIIQNTDAQHEKKHNNAVDDVIRTKNNYFKNHDHHNYITIAIDPGHGGEDPGAIGPSGTHEKTVVLDISKRLQSKIDKEPFMKAILIRDSDFFVPLHMRVKKARQMQADLFVSIHADAFTSPTAHGSSVYTLSDHGASSIEASWLAKQENTSDEIGGIKFWTKNPSLLNILLDMSTAAQMRNSFHYGNCVLNELSKINKLHKTSVEKAGFAVLRAPDIPSILVETAFISNPVEEKKLQNSLYREQLAEAIFQGIKKYCHII